MRMVYASSGVIVTVLGLGPSVRSKFGDGGLSTAAAVSGLCGVVVKPSGDILVAVSDIAFCNWVS